MNRRNFIRVSGLAITSAALLPVQILAANHTQMKTEKEYDVVIIGGSYSGLSAALALARSLRNILIIDSGSPCNAVVSYSHNFLTHDGESPATLARVSREQVLKYENVEFHRGQANSIVSQSGKYRVLTTTGQSFTCKKLVFATGIIDILPPIPGINECWGKTVLHCPYCHGFEVKGKTTAVLATSEQAFEYVMLLTNWTDRLHVITNGTSPFSEIQQHLLAKHNVQVHVEPLVALNHNAGQLQSIQFADGTSFSTDVLYTRMPFLQKCALPQELGCAIDTQGYIITDASGKTNVAGIYACGDNTSKNRTISNAVAMGTNAGMAINKELTVESY